MKGFVLGIFTTMIVALVGAYLFIAAGALSAGQDVRPGRLERWISKTALRAAIGRQTTGRTDQMQATDDNLAAGCALYIAHCQICHGGPDGAASVIAKGLTPNPPQLVRDGVEDDPPATIHWKITHGIRFTGMPAFGQTLSDREIWNMTFFLKRMDSLPPAARKAWEASKSGPPVAYRAGDVPVVEVGSPTMNTLPEGTPGSIRTPPP
jgi:mono/diheme cytochrome c family protein